jgi:hypothetical protein
MTKTSRLPSLLSTLSALLIAVPSAQAAPTKSHHEVVQSVTNMVSDSKLQRLAKRFDLQILNVLWEDTGRYLGSSVGPNISDVTIEVQSENKQGKLSTSLMPVIRFPNFTDKTGDIDIDKFFVRVGNQQKGADELKTVSLRELLAHPTRYMSFAKNGTIKGGTLIADRDDKVLVSAQAAFLPIRSGTKAKFWPVIFNYQSYDKNPAVLTILVTRQGTSMSIIDNTRDTVTGGGSWGQRLYFNTGGERAPLTAERLADVKSSGKTSNGESASSLGDDANLLMLIQVPLKVKRGRYQGYEMEESAAVKSSTRSRSGADLDVAVLGHGPTEGPYTELDGLTIERDDRFPVRVTVQFYQATSTGVVGKHEMSALAGQIKKVYDKADYVGSLVIPEGAPRPTMWTDATPAPANLDWRAFPGLVERFNKYGLGLGWTSRWSTN